MALRVTRLDTASYLRKRRADDLDVMLVCCRLRARHTVLAKMPKQLVVAMATAAAGF